MVARQVFDKLPALSPMITCDTEPFDNPVENSTKRRRPAWSECRACLGLRTARHVKLLTDLALSFFACPFAATR
jgi:hypothetical protein